MDLGILIPLAVFAVVVVIVAFVSLAGIRDTEVAVHHELVLEETRHRERMSDLDRKLEQARLDR